MIKSIHSLIEFKYLYLAIALIPIIIGIIGFITLMDSSYTGLHFEQRDDKWYVSSIDANSPASQYPNLVGKEVVIIEDRKLEQYDLIEYPDDIKPKNDYNHFWDSQTYLNHYIKPGSLVELTIGNLERTKITSSSISLFHIISTNIISLTVFIFSLLVGLLVIFKKPKNAHARVLFLIILAMSAYIITVMLYTSRDIVLDMGIFKFFVMLNSLAGTYIGVTLLHFSLIFPKVKSYVYNKIIIPVIYILPLIILYLYQMRISWESHYIFTFSCILLGIILIIHTFITLHSPTERAQTKIVLWGAALFLVSASALHLFPILILGHRIFSDAALFPLILIIPIFVTFSIFKYGLMDIDTLFDNTLIYSITIGLLALIDITVVYILTSNKMLLPIFKELFSTILAVLVIIFAYLPVRNLVQKQIKKILKREIYDTNTISLKLSKDLISASDTQSAFDKTITVINNALHPKGNSVLLSQHGSIVIENGWLNTEQLNAVKSPTHLYQMSNIDILPKNYTGGICVPIIGTKKSLGHLILQNKHSERLYDKEDIKLLSIIAAQLAMTIEAIMAREEQEREKEKISREIHDGLGSTFSKAKLLINNIKLNGNKEIGELENVIDDGLKDMREFLWAVEQGENTLNDVIFYIQDKIKHLKNIIDIEIQADIDNGDIIISPNVKLAIVRIAQEAITNATKHAQATKINISFIQHDHRLTIKIADNGKGFDTEVTRYKNYGLRNMKRRCAEIGGELEVVSVPGEGAKVNATIKL